MKISSEEFNQLVSRFNAHLPTQTKSILLEKEPVADLLADKSVTGLRVHLGMTEKGAITVILAGDGEQQESEPTYLNRGQLCPPNCPD